MAANTPADVAVDDASTGGTTVMQAVLSYSAPGVETIALVSAPATVNIGVASGVPFAVRVFEADGVTPVPGATVLLAATGTATTFASCGAAICTLITDTNGLAQSAITAASAGAITLTAIEQSGGAFVQAIVNAVASVRVVASLSAPRYLAAGATASWNVSVVATQNGLPVAAQGVAWTAAPGLTLGAATTVTDTTGTASVSVSTTGLAGGTQVAVQGCAWITVCVATTVFGVDPSQWTVAAVSGAGQSVQVPAPLAPVVLLIADPAGHPLQGATVNVYQTVDAWEGLCPARGRCAAAPVLASSQAVLTTDANGLVTVTPLVVLGVPSVVHIAAATGTQGFVSLALTVMP